MGYLIQNERTVYSISSYQPLFIYSQTDKYMMGISKVQSSKEGRKTGLLDGVKNFFGEKFSVDRIYGEEQIQQVTDDPQSLIVNLQLGENCLIAGKDEDGKLDGGFMVSTYPDADSGVYNGTSISGLPNFVVNFFSNKYGETDVEALREQINQTENNDFNIVSGVQVTDLTQEGATLPTFSIPYEQEMEL